MKGGHEKKPQNIPMNPGETKAIKEVIFDLSERGAKQALYGVVQILGVKASVSRSMFEEIVDDARKYCQVIWRKP